MQVQFQEAFCLYLDPQGSAHNAKTNPSFLVPDYVCTSAQHVQEFVSHMMDLYMQEMCPDRNEQEILARVRQDMHDWVQDPTDAVVLWIYTVYVARLVPTPVHATGVPNEWDRLVSDVHWATGPTSDRCSLQLVDQLDDAAARLRAMLEPK